MSALPGLAKLPTLLTVCLAALFLVFLGPFDSDIPDAEADSLLVNGDFESGTTAWAGVSSAGCEPHSGSGAGAVTTVGTAQARQWVDDVGHGAAYHLSGYVKVKSGTATVKVVVNWFSGDSAIAGLPQLLAPGSDYTSFSKTGIASPPSADAAQVIIEVAAAGGPTTVCLDDLVLEGPPPETPTPTSTSMPPETATGTRTPTPGAGTATPKATKTPAPQATTSLVAAGAGTTLVNGDFEQGTAGWQKYGGELRSVSSPTHSGRGAGALLSSTSSTKWAYQVVAVVPGAGYELSAFVLPAPGVSDAYLRISWYASLDGSGRSIGASDSTSHTSPGGEGYVPLTTGGVAAPAQALSARVRLVMQPAGASTAALYMDDVSFGPATVSEEASAVTPVAGDEAAAPDEEEILAATEPVATRSPTITRTRSPSPAATSTITPRPSATAEPTAGVIKEIGEQSTVEPRKAGGAGPWTWAGAGALFAMSGGATYFYVRRQRRH